MADIILNKDKSMLTRMELDLTTKARDAFNSAGISSSVYGIFSLDDLEQQRESDICAANTIAVGVGYHGAKNVMEDEKGNGANGHGRTAMNEFRYMVVLAVPAGKDCDIRYNAGELLTIMRLSIHGSQVDGAAAARTWQFVSEAPNISQSSDDILYYVQIWQTKLPQSPNR